MSDNEQTSTSKSTENHADLNVTAYQPTPQRENIKQQKFSRKQNERFELLFVGDLSFGENYQEERKEKGGVNILEEKGYDYSLEKMKPLMQSADFVVANLETPITDLKQSPFAEIKDYVHWTHVEKAPKTLISHNVSLVSLANNHAYDYGKAGYDQTLNILERYRLPVIGAGENIEQAIEPFIGEIAFEDKKFKFAILSAFEDIPSYRQKYQVYSTTDKPGLMPLDLDVILNQVKKLKNDDPDTFVIFYPHWGANYRWSDSEQREVSDKLLSQGVDLIIGHGAHMIQEFEKRQGKWAFYSLGNFMFNSPGRYAKLNAPPYSYVAKLGIELVNNTFELNVKLYPIFTDNRVTDYQPRFLNEEEFYQLFETIQNRPASRETQYYSLNRKRDEMGFYIEIPLQSKQTPTQQSETKWIGMFCRTENARKMQEKMSLWMYHALVIQQELSHHDYKLFCYSPVDINPNNKTAWGYVLEHGQFRKIKLPLPSVNYDWYIGKEEMTNKPGFEYDDFEPWALQNGYQILPTKATRKLASDKLLTYKVLSTLDSSLVAVTEAFAGEADQIARFLEKMPKIFLKPRFGSQGNGIIVLEAKQNQYHIEFYQAKEKITQTFSSLAESLTFIKDKAQQRKYIIQEAINCISLRNSVFDIRVIMLHDGKAWHHLSQIRLGGSGKMLSNIAQGGEVCTTEDILAQAFSPALVDEINQKIKNRSEEIAVFLKEKYDNTIGEMAMDLLIDADQNIMVTELNIKCGTEGRPVKLQNFFQMNAEEKSHYENLSLNHGKYLAQYLMNNARAAKSILPQVTTSPAVRSNTATKWLGMVCNFKKQTVTIKGKIYPWMFRQLVLDQLLEKYNYKVFAYSPSEIDSNTQQATGYVINQGEFTQVKRKIPKINYDFYMGKTIPSARKGLPYQEFEPWANKQGCEIYPNRSLRLLARDKLRSAQFIAEYDKNLVPYTELFTGQFSQIEKFLQIDKRVFIKPRSGNKGDNIFVIQLQGKKIRIEFYFNNKRQSASFDSLPEIAPFFRRHAVKQDYIIQQAIDVMSHQGSVSNIRTIVFKEKNAWHFLSELVLSKKASAVSNPYQGGQNYETEAFLHQIFPKAQALAIFEKIKNVSIQVAKFIDDKHEGQVNELAFDLLLDKNLNLYVSEINVKPGLAGAPTPYKLPSKFTEAERRLFETVTIKHADYLVKSLLSITPEKKAEKQQTKWIGFVWRDRNIAGLKKRIYPWMHRLLVIEKELSKYNYKLICFSPPDVDPSKNTVNGYVLENNWFKKITIPVPKMNYFKKHKDINPGLTYLDFENWASQNGCELYPPKAVRDITLDKLHTFNALSEFDKSIVPFAEAYTGDVDQAEKFIKTYASVFVKPRLGSQGKNIFVIKATNSSYTVDHYIEGKKNTYTFSLVEECVSYVNQHESNKNSLIQEGIACIRYEGAAILIRAITLREGKTWHFLSEATLGEKEKDVSNIYQGGEYIKTEALLEKIYSKQQTATILEKIQKLALSVSAYLDSRCAGGVHELSFDLMMDKSQQLYIAEINTPPGLAGPSYPGLELPLKEAPSYESVTLNHGKYLAKSLLSRLQDQKLEGSLWFDDLKKKETLDSETLKKVLDAIFSAFQNKQMQMSKLPEGVIDDETPQILFLTISDNVSKTKTCLGAGKGLLQAINSAMQRLSAMTVNFDFHSVKLDIVTEVKALPNHDVDAKLPFDRSLFGFAFDSKLKLAFLPEESVTHTLINSSQLLRPRQIIDVVPLLQAQQNRLKNQHQFDLFAFSVQSAYQSKENQVSLYRGHRLFNKIDTDLLLTSAIAAGNYLQSAVKENGDFVYQYSPKTDSETGGYNVLRHAGTIYSMLELYELTKNASLLASATRALTNLIDRAQPLKVKNEDLLCIVEKDAAKLGANGLTLLALSKYISLTGDRQYIEQARKLAKWMQTIQNERGEFFIHKQTFSTQKDSGFVSMYYPGEAIFSLVRFNEVDPNETWINMAEKAADFLINIRDKDKPINKLEHDHWLLYGLNELYRVRSHEHYVTHTQKICQAIMNAQHKKSPYPDYLGGFYTPPRSTPVAVRAEGMCAAYRLLNDLQYYKQADMLLESIEGCIRFQLQTQYFPERAIHLKNPQRALGGFCCSLTDYSIRIDYVQHNLSSLISFYNILKRPR